MQQSILIPYFLIQTCQEHVDLLVVSHKLLVQCVPVMLQFCIITTLWDSDMTVHLIQVPNSRYQ